MTEIEGTNINEPLRGTRQVRVLGSLYEWTLEWGDDWWSVHRMVKPGEGFIHEMRTGVTEADIDAAKVRFPACLSKLR